VIVAEASALEMRPADDDPREPAIGAQLPAAVLVPQEVAREIARQGTVGDQGVHHSGKIVGQDAVAGWQQAVRVLSLGNALAAGGGDGQFVALDQRDVVEMVGQRPRRAEPCHASTQHDRVLSTRCHDFQPPSIGTPSYARRPLEDHCV